MPDTAIPIFQTVNQNGEATLEVEAVIKALGLTLQEKSALNEKLNQIIWVDANGVTRETISGYTGATTEDHLLQASSEPEAQHKARLNMNVLASLGLSEIDAIAEYGNTQFSLAKIIDSLGRSNFLQVAGTAANWHCNFGTITAVTWAGLTAFSETYTISHGIGKTPVMILATVEPVGVNGAVVQVSAKTATNFHMQCYTPAQVPTAGLTVNLSWLAIG